MAKVVCYISPFALAKTINSELVFAEHFFFVAKYSIKNPMVDFILSTVNSEIFMRVLFMRNLADAKFRRNKTLAKW